ncbi:MAG: PhnD/SsuA/transferrin family substrate-binding protein [Paracoccaceae bacterium]|nr:PhnD/SsuA/transferrin family substrate-binding protein [Paracoccaceae bacterium]
MYDGPTTRSANDRFWRLTRNRLGFGPDNLNRTDDPHDTWVRPDLVMSQTCGLPFRSGLHGRVSLIGTPDYGVTGCPPGYYNSCVIVRRDDPRRSLSDFKNARLARNDVRSQSGWASIEGHLAENDFGFSFLGKTLDTGSHAASARAVLDGTVDIAAIDAVSWALFQRETPAAQDLRVLVSTRPTPGLPIISSATADKDQLFQAISSALEALPEKDKASLLIKGLIAIPPEAYLSEPLPPA